MIGGCVGVALKRWGGGFFPTLADDVLGGGLVVLNSIQPSLDLSLDM